MNERMTEIEARLSAIRDEILADGADLDALEAETRALKEEQAEIRANEEKRAALLKDVEINATPVEEQEKEERHIMTNAEVRQSKEYIDAFARYIKTGKDEECRKLLSENVSGVVPVPSFVEGRVRAAWENNSLMQYVRKTYLPGNVKIGFEISATGAVIHTEGTSAPAEETLTLGTITLTPQSIKKWITISDEVMDMGGQEFLDYIYDEIVYQIAKKAADTLVNTIATLGTASTTNAVGAAQVKGAPGVGIVAQAMGALSDVAANPIVVMNKATWAAFKAAQYAASYAVDPFEGLPVVFNNSLPTYASASTGSAYAIVGDFGVGAQANFPNGEEITLKYDDLSLAESDLVKIVGREFVGIGAVTPFAFANIVK